MRQEEDLKRYEGKRLSHVPGSVNLSHARYHRARYSRAANMAGVLFEDIFNVKDIDPEGKKFDRGELCRASRVVIAARCPVFARAAVFTR